MPALIYLSIFFYIAAFYRRSLVFGGLLCQAGYMAYRGITLGRLPIIGPHDTLLFMSVSTVLFATAITAQQKNRSKILLPLAGLSFLLTVLSLFYKPHSTPLPPVLKTFWFESHVALSFFAYALFGIAAVIGLLFLKNRDSDIELLQYRTILVGYCMFSTAMILGGIWAYLAWGTYWLWTPKELWTVILWLFYSLYLHTRLRQWWTGRPAALLGIAGFAIVMFTYLGVSLFMKSSHSF